MNNFIYAELDDKTNSFHINAFMKLFDIEKTGEIEIDTGCSYSNISFKKFFKVTDKEALKYKRNAIIAHRPYALSYGVSDTNKDKLKQKDLVSRHKYIECTAISYIYQISINLSGYIINHSIRVNYDREGNSLLGMDILKDFDFHVGVSQITGKCTFIGCLRDRINDEYLTAILQHFGYLPREYAEQTCINLRNQAYREGVHQGYIAGSWADYCTKNKEKKFFRRRGDVIR